MNKDKKLILRWYFIGVILVASISCLSLTYFLKSLEPIKFLFGFTLPIFVYFGIILIKQIKEVKMDKANQMQPGTWDRIGTEDSNSDEKVKFEVNIAQKVTITNPVPNERTGDDGGIYYVFEVQQDSKPKIIQTSAWTLLKELKKANLKAGMVLEITKKLQKGKQFFEVRVAA